MEKREKTWLKIISAEVERRVSDAIERVIKREAVFCYTEKEAAVLLKMEQDTLYRLRQKNEIGHIKLCDSQRMIRYKPEHLEEFLKRFEIPCGGGISDRKISHSLKGYKQ